MDWTGLYLSKLPVRCEWGMGTCTDCSVLYAMELRGLILGQPVVQLSQLFSAWGQHEDGSGGSTGVALMNAKATGVCSEYLWPITMIGLDWNLNDSMLGRAVWQMTPTDAARYDAQYHKVLDYGPVSGTAQAKAALDQGYPVIAYQPPNHMLCIMGYDDSIGAWLGFDERSTSATPFRLSYASLSPWTIVRDVQFQPSPTYVLTDDQVTRMGTWRSRITLNSGSPPTANVPEDLAGEIEAMAAQIGPIVSMTPVPVQGPPPPPSSGTRTPA